MGIFGLSETKLSPSTVKAIFYNDHQSSFISYWSCNPSSPVSCGVGLLIKSPYCNHVQKITRWNGRLIAADLYFSSYKLRVINCYVPFSTGTRVPDFTAFFAEFSSFLSSSLKDNFRILIMGDFNADITDYLDRISHFPTFPLKFKPFNLMLSKGFLSHHNSINNSPAPSFQHTATSGPGSGVISRLDYIWASQNFDLPILHSDTVWLDFTNHAAVISCADSSSLFSI